MITTIHKDLMPEQNREQRRAEAARMRKQPQLLREYRAREHRKLVAASKKAGLAIRLARIAKKKFTKVIRKTT